MKRLKGQNISVEAFKTKKNNNMEAENDRKTEFLDNVQIMI